MTHTYIWKMLHLQQNLYNITKRRRLRRIHYPTCSALPWDPQMRQANQLLSLLPIYTHSPFSLSLSLSLLSLSPSPSPSLSFLLSPFSLSLFSLLHTLTQKIKALVGVDNYKKNIFLYFWCFFLFIKCSNICMYIYKNQ